MIFNGNNTLQIVSDAFSSRATLSLSGNEAKIYGGDGNDTVNNESSGVKIYGQNGADSINNSGTNASISGGADNDYVYNSGNKSYISLGDGVDSVWNTAEDALILGGNGADVLTNQGNSVIIRGDAGNDNLRNFGDYGSLLGGKGNDTFIYQAGEGKDKIFDYSSGDLLQIVDGTFTKSKYSNGTLSLTISGVGQITFDNVTTSTDFNINGTSYKVSGSKLVEK